MLSNKKNYRKSLIEAYKGLIQIREDVFTSALNIAMAGELEDINDVFEEGDEYEFHIEHLEGSNDTNLNKFLELFEYLEIIMHTLANINAISENELEDS